MEWSYQVVGQQATNLVLHEGLELHLLCARHGRLGEGLNEFLRLGVKLRLGADGLEILFAPKPQAHEHVQEPQPEIAGVD